MCVVSMIGDYYGDKWRRPWETTGPGQAPWDYPTSPPIYNPELNKLRKEVEEMKELLKRAIEYDKKNNQPHCEQEDKIAFLRKVADSVGVDLKDVFDG